MGTWLLLIVGGLFFIRILHTAPDGSFDADLLAHAQDVVRSQMRKLRDREGLTQADAAARLGWNQPYWNRLENGAIELRLGHLLAIQAALRIDSLEALFGYLPSQLVGRGEAPRD